MKSSLAPGSRVVTDYYERAGLQRYLDELGFNTVGYGCTTCIGNSGPLPPTRSRQAIAEGDLVACAVLSGNRNFEARIHPEVKANYLASPPLVVAYALAGRMDVDLEHEPLGQGRDGSDVFLRDVWPSSAEIEATIASSVHGEMFTSTYADVFTGDEAWRSLPVPDGDLLRVGGEPRPTCAGRATSRGSRASRAPSRDIEGARCLVVLGDSVTTDHISPAGSIRPDSPAGRYLVEHGVEPRDFNSYGARRGNHEVMVRGTFANVRLRNLLVPGSEGTRTVHVPSGEQMTIFDASRRYLAEGTPLIVLAGKEYGTGSSRDWAAKGPLLLGVRAVIAETYERIHRSNLLMMGILPLQFLPGESRESLGLTGREEFAIRGIENGEAREVTVSADGREFRAQSCGWTRRASASSCATAASCRSSCEARRLRLSCRTLAGYRAKAQPVNVVQRLAGSAASATLLQAQPGCREERLRSHPSNLIRVMPAKEALGLPVAGRNGMRERLNRNLSRRRREADLKTRRTGESSPFRSACACSARSTRSCSGRTSASRCSCSSRRATSRSR